MSDCKTTPLPHCPHVAVCKPDDEIADDRVGGEAVVWLSVGEARSDCSQEVEILQFERDRPRWPSDKKRGLRRCEALIGVLSKEHE